MPAERWRNPPAKPQARANHRSPSPNQSPITRVRSGRGPQSPSPRESPICFGLGSPRPRESPILLCTPESESKEESDYFLPQSPSPRGSPISVGLQSPMDSSAWCSLRRHQTRLVVRLWGRPASACKPYRIKSNQKSRFLRAAKAVGLAFSDRFKSPSFSKFNCLHICRMQFAQKSASQCDSISSIDITI
jgi:hypothetical protein